MAGIKASLAFAGTIGLTLVFVGCVLPSSWWPLIVVLFYFLAPLPTILARRYTDDASGSSNPCLELAIFITMGIVISSFALPIVLNHAPEGDPVIKPIACYLTLAGNVIVYLTIIGFFITFDQDDSEYTMW